MDGFRCPVCTGSLYPGERVWRCAEGHSFDVAREGYVNLLPVQHRHSRAPGDEPRMVQARRQFLDAGHYAPLQSALNDQLRPLQPRRLLDVGCGEGYYTAAFQEIAPEVIGLDISRPAVRLAARRTRAVTWLVATAAHLPFADATVDTLCQLFTPLHPPELARVLAPDGVLLLATPSADHLLSLRARLFDQVEPHRPLKLHAALQQDFDALSPVSLRFGLSLDGPALRQLLSMTPYAWRARPQRRAALEACEGLDTEAAFTLLPFRRKRNAETADAPG